MAERQVRVRFIVEPERSGSFNMARDYYFLERASRLKDEIVFTVFKFNPPCISTGKFQKIDDDLVEKAFNAGIEIVRRPTGGRAVIHGSSDLTYSFVASYIHGFEKRKIIENYRKINGFLLSAFKKILNAEIVYRTDSSRRGVYTEKSACFAASLDSDLTIEGRKICGSALRWLDDAVLQHGTIYLDFPEEIHKIIFGNEATEDIRKKIITLSEAAGRNVSEKEIVDALHEGFSGSGFEVYISSLSPQEIEEIKKFEEMFAVPFEIEKKNNC